MNNPKDEFVEDLTKGTENSEQKEDQNSEVKDEIDYTKLSSEELLNLYKEKYPEEYNKLIEDIIAKM